MQSPEFKPQSHKNSSTSMCHRYTLEREAWVQTLALVLATLGMETSLFLLFSILHLR
jgi:hypothetical protein